MTIPLPENQTAVFLITVTGLTALGLILVLIFKFPSRHKRKTAGFRIIACSAILLATYYLYWRYRFSLNRDALWLAIPLVLAETYAYFDSVLFLVMMWKPTYRQAPEPADTPDVDIFITTYNEPVDLVRMTVKGAMRIDWDRKKVYILDDGNRQEFRDLAKEMGCEIITRGKDWQGKPRHAKAGNVNNALFQTSGEFILILDADQIPTPEIIKKTVGYFRDENLAFVQTPQHFYNLPPKDPFGSDAPLFYGPILQGKDGWNAAFFCGSNAVLRREALLQVGIIEYSKAMMKHAEHILSDMKKRLSRYRPNTEHERSFVSAVLKAAEQGKEMLDRGVSLEEIFSLIRKTIKETELVMLHPETFLPGLPPDFMETLELTRPEEAIPLLPMSTISVTEDMATSIRLHSYKWKSVFHPEILAYGLAPEDLGSALSQRLRWAQGTIQILVKENPLNVKGLTFTQRLQYFTTIYSYFSGFASLIFIAAPVIFLFTGIAPVKVYSGEFLWRLIPFLIMNRLMFRYTATGLNIRRGEQYSLALFPVWIKAVMGVLFGRKPQFVVTPKQRQSGNFLSLVRPQILCVLLSFAALMYCVVQLLTGIQFDTTGIIINTFWAAYNSAALLAIIMAAVYKPPKDWEIKLPERINFN